MLNTPKVAEKPKPMEHQSMCTIYYFCEALPNPYVHEYLCIFLHTYTLLTPWLMPSGGMWGYVSASPMLSIAQSPQFYLVSA